MTALFRQGQKTAMCRMTWMGLMYSLSLFIQMGCAGGNGQSGSDDGVRAAMKLLGLEYGSFMAENNGTPPASEAAMRAYLQSRLVSLKDFGVKRPDDLLPAGRDGRPLTIIYLVKRPATERGDVVWSAYEETPVDGFRLACDSRGGIHELSDETFTQLFAR